MCPDEIINSLDSESEVSSLSGLETVQQVEEIPDSKESIENQETEKQFSKRKRKKEIQPTEEIIEDTSNKQVMKQNRIKITNISNQALLLQFTNNKTAWLPKNKFIIKTNDEISKSIRLLESKMYLSLEQFNAN